MKRSSAGLLALLTAVLLVSGCATSYYHSGNRFYSQMAYDAAVDKYKKALDKHLSTKYQEDAKRKLADSYRKMKDVANAEKYYKEVADMPDATPQDRMYAAQAMMANGHYDDAKVQLKTYLDHTPSDQAAQKLYVSMDSIAHWKADSTKYVIDVPNVNGGGSNMNPAWMQQGLLFASDRDGKKIYEWNGRPFLDLYYAKENAPGSFDKAEKLKGTINSKYHDAAAVVAPDGKTIYFTSNNMKGKHIKRSKTNGVAMLKIYKATLKGSDWTDVTPLSFNSDNYSCGHPAISADGNTMYFTSDMPGGSGGTDIYMSKRKGDDWGTPQNLGTTVNTPFDEMFPTINGDDLYFSSEGHYNMGGLDIFKTTNTNGTWSEPQNMGYPINSSHDDFGMITRGDSTGYFTSNRRSADGKVDNIMRYKRVNLKFNLEVLAVNKSDNMKPLPGVNVDLLNKRTGQKISQVTGEDGTTHFKLDENTDYSVLGSKEGFFSNSAEVSTVGKTQSENLNTKLVLEMEVMKVNEPIALKNIYYDYDKANIRPDAAKDLDHLVKIMQDNPTILVELASHTDSRGSEAYNMKLSQRRADAAVKYIVAKGISKKRITAKGYGESRLLNKCKDGVKCTEAEHQLNRRTEFSVTGFTDQKEPIKSQQ